MATPASRPVQTQVSDVVECSVCRETYSDPRQLPCIHSFCLKCIRELCRDKLPGDAVACPLSQCRKKFNIPQDGVAALPHNNFVEQLKTMASPLKSNCEVCSTNETKAYARKTASMFCVDCNERLCETCADMHRRMKVSKGHQLVKQEVDDKSSDKKMRVTKACCAAHHDEFMKLYCLDCKTAICAMCFVKSHKLHACSDINEVADEFRGKMTGDIEIMVDTVARCREVIKEQSQNKEKFNIKVDEIERQICDNADRLQQLIEQEKSTLLKELVSFKVDRNKQMDNVVEEIERHISSVESLRSYTELLRDSGRSGDVAQQRSTLQERADELMKLDVIQQAVNNVGSVDIKFTAATWSIKSGGILGKISKKRCDVNSGARLENKTSGQVKSPLPTTTKPVETSPSHVISSDDPWGGEVVGVTVCNDKLFVLRVISKESIEQYDARTLERLRPITVSGLSDGSWWWWSWCKTLTSCNTDQCLYVNDSNSVFRIDLSTEKVTSWRVDGLPYGLSVNRAGNVLVTCRDDGVIKEYSSNGSLVRSIRPQVNHVTRPYHAVQLSDSLYVVSNWRPEESLSLIDQQGAVVASYRNSKTTQLVNIPRWIALVNNDILVADGNNNRILLLNNSLSDAREVSLPVNSQLKQPCCIYLDQSNGRLFVGEVSGRVLVIDHVNLTC